MATTGAPGNIPLFGDSDPVTPIQNPLNAISSATNAALTPATATITASTGFTDASHVWKAAGYVYGVITTQSSSDIAAGASTKVATLPAGFRPGNSPLYTGVAFYDVAPYPVVFQIDSGGGVTFFNGSSAQRSFAGFFAFPQVN